MFYRCFDPCHKGSFSVYAQYAHHVLYIGQNYLLHDRKNSVGGLSDVNSQWLIMLCECLNVLFVFFANFCVLFSVTNCVSLRDGVKMTAAIPNQTQNSQF